MRDYTELYAINENGQKILGPLLEPFWKTVFCAFLNKADEVTVRANRENASDMDVKYQKGEEIFHLTPAEGFHPFITSSRIRIISGMAITPDLVQNGKMRVKFNGDVLIIEAKIEVEKGNEKLRLIPQWK